MPVVLDEIAARQEQVFQFYSRPNCSLSARGSKQVLWAIAAVTLLIASAFAALGYWLMLPFAGLEIGVLAWAFESLSRRSDDFETLTIRDDRVVIERRQGHHVERLELNRPWVCLVCSHDRPGGRVRVALRSHGREIDLGLFLTDESRSELGRSLQTWFRPGR